MKTLTILTIAAITLFPSFSFAAKTQDQGDALSAQIGITRDALQQVLAKMRSVQESQMGSNPDFVVKADEFNKKVEVALAKFEAKLQDPVFKQAIFYIDYLNAIQDSMAYTREQKKAIIADQVKLANTIFADLSKVYAAAILELYLLDFGFEFNEVDEFNDGNSAHKYIEYFFGKYWGSPVEIKDIVFANKIKRGCFSNSCLALYSNHRVTYINLIRNDVDKEIKFKIAGYEIVLKPLNLNSKYLKEYVEIGDGDLFGMPFRITEREYKDLIAKEMRQAKLVALQDKLINPSGGFFSSYECPASVTKIKEELCQSELRCINSEEANAIMQAIKDADIYNKSARIECLNQR